MAIQTKTRKARERSIGKWLRGKWPSTTLNAALGICVAMAAAVPADAQITPTIRLGIAHTDNVQLAAENGDDETIVLLEPALLIDYQSERITSAVDYRMQALEYLDGSETEVFHTGTATVTFDLLKDELFLNAGVRRDQSISDLTQPIPVNNLPFAGNRVDRDEYFISPSFTRRIGSSVTAAGSYRQTRVEIQGGGLQNNDQSLANFSLDNYLGGQGLTWAVRYNWQRVEYDIAQPFENQTALLELGFWLNSSLRVFGSGGLESDWEVPLDPALEAETWEAGIVYSVGDRAQLTLAGGERSFGASARALLQLTGRSSTLNVSFTQRPATLGAQPVRTDGPSAPDLLFDLLDQQGQTQRFVANRFELTWTLALRRLNLQARGFIEERTDRTTAAGELLSDQEQDGQGLSATYQLGARTSVGLDIARQVFDLGDGTDRELIRTAINASYSLGARTQLEFSYAYNDQDSDQIAMGPPNNADFVSNVVTLTISRTF
ncbi:MAG: TIGR03016 family PEP-CTERM system-associated outer membrane protein [Pseudomonadota bacterium]